MDSQRLIGLFSRVSRVAGSFVLLAAVLACSEAVEETKTEIPASAELPLPPATAAANDVVITNANVFEQERHWPNIVSLTKEWRPPGEPDAEKVLQPGVRGALIRVDLLPVDDDSRSEAGGAPVMRAHARIDFGRHGPHDVPIDRTDLVQRANEVRRGLRNKTAPNFVLQVGTRLVDSSHEALRPVISNALAEAQQMFLCVFANPEGAGFEALVRELADLEEIDGLRTIFFPQASNRSQLASVKETLQALSWTVPFAYSHLSEGYTRALIGAATETPFALLVTPNGRVLYRSKLTDARSFDGLRDAADLRALEGLEALDR